jgi:GNAT superfamily N-acetyltransferase
MSDMLVRLYDLPKKERKVPDGVEVRRALSLERHLAYDWVDRTFNTGWASECEISFSRVPIACFIATVDGTIIGFCCYDSTSRGVAGPMGVAEAHRGKNIGSALILEALSDMKANGYAYAILGWVGPDKFFERVVGATVIEGSEPGLYRGLLPGTMNWGESQ